MSSFRKEICSWPERNPLFALYVTMVADVLEAVEGEEQWPDPFRLSDAALFASALTSAGFREVQVQAIAQTFQFPSFEVLTTWWGHPFEKALAQPEPEPRQRMLEEVRQAVRQYEGSQGIVAPAELLLGAGMK